MKKKNLYRMSEAEQEVRRTEMRREAEEMARRKYPNFNNYGIHRFDLISECLQELYWQEEAEYWAPVVRSMERDEKEAQFSDATDPHALWEWQAGQVYDRDEEV